MSNQEGPTIRIERTKGVVAMTDDEFRLAMSTDGGIVALSADALKMPGAVFHVQIVKPGQ